MIVEPVEPGMECSVALDPEGDGVTWEAVLSRWTTVYPLRGESREGAFQALADLRRTVESMPLADESARAPMLAAIDAEWVMQCRTENAQARIRRRDTK